METIFAENLRKLRESRGLTQSQLGKLIFVNRSTIARWENGSRMPDAAIITRLASHLGVEASVLLRMEAESETIPNIILVDRGREVLTRSLGVLEEVMPGAAITGFIQPQEAVDYAKVNRVALALLEVELGTMTGFDLCKRLMEINPRTNVIFLTACADYALDAWESDACGFLLKPMTPEGIRKQMKRLRFPFSAGGEP